MMQAEYLILSVLIMIAFYTDMRSSKISNKLTISGVMIGLIYHVIISGWQGFIFSAIGMVVGFGIFIILYLFRAIGAGDVKLFAAIGALTGLEFVLYASMYSIFYAGIIGLIIVIMRREFFKRIMRIISYFLQVLLHKDRDSYTSFKKSESLHFPFMYAVLPGIITTYYYFVWA